LEDFLGKSQTGLPRCLIRLYPPHGPARLGGTKKRVPFSPNEATRHPAA